MENRIEKKLEELSRRNEKAFITYLTAGLPDMEKTKELLRAEERGGVDVIELGVPFSDPVADGPMIQAASYDAIQGGANLKKTLAAMKELREEGFETPVILMLYYNTVLHHGVAEFAEGCRRAGVDGVIVPDLPLEEQGELQAALREKDEVILLQLVSPVSGERIGKIAEGARGFLYCVSSMGVTGNASFHRALRQYLTSVRAVSGIPVMLGFGIKKAADTAHVIDLIDGAIVGSELIRILRERDYDPKAAEEYVRTFKKELMEL